jgi:hypothetical protein
MSAIDPTTTLAALVAEQPRAHSYSNGYYGESPGRISTRASA